MTLPLWIIPALPLAGFAVNGLLGKRLGKSFVSAVGTGSVGLAAVVADALLEGDDVKRFLGLRQDRALPSQPPCRPGLASSIPLRS